MCCRAASSLCLIVCAVQAAAQAGLIEARNPSAQGADGLWSDTEQSNIDAVVNAAKSLIEQAFPEWTPTNVNLQTVQWPSTFDIGGTTYTGVPTGVPSAPTATPTSVTWEALTSSSAMPTPSSSERGTTTSDTSLDTSTPATRTSSATKVPTSSIHGVGEVKSNTGDRKVAIALGILFILASLILAGAVFFALWRRKRQAGTYFKAARCSECVTTPTTSVLFGASSTSPWRSEHNEPSRSWFAGARSAVTGSGRSARSNSIRANFPEMTESAERLPIPVEEVKTHVSSQEIVPVVCLTQPRGHTRLRKSYSSAQADVSGFSNITPSTPLELAGDDLAVITEMDAESPTRTASSLRRLSSFPFVLPSGAPAPRGDASFAISRSSSGNTKISELDAESPRTRRRGTSLTRLSINPVIMAQLAEAEADYHSNTHYADISRSNSDNSRPSEMDGESPTRRASTWRELQRSTFTVEDLAAEITSFNILCEIAENSDSETSSLEEYDNGVTGSVLDHMDSTPWSELRDHSVRCTSTSPTSTDSSASQSSSDEHASQEETEEEGPIGFIFTARDTLPASEIRTTELILPPRLPQPTYSRETTSSISPLSSPPTASYAQQLPIDNRNLILSRARFKSSNISQAEISPLPPTTKSNAPGWAPAGAYASSPIWRKKRPAPLSPDFLRPSSALSGSGSFEDLYSNPRASPYEAGNARGRTEADVSLPFRRRPRPQPLTPDWLPESLRAGTSVIKIADDGEDHDLDLGDDHAQGGFSSKQNRDLNREPYHDVGHLPSAVGVEMF
ncbi:hypothetical protein Slin15195_G008030 [Septoria linicola]|uniref:Uncharacterized protein n=1 Tax=Septoria linicola TaxID=215465 RepID=A0A9Q9AH12_9PEZI|nr:hypothetical protein Slin14017_G008040 [Septoria linicola]USW47484.1 hypothetical protein Slin15195_G008030 [Septoria linicola]